MTKFVFYNIILPLSSTISYILSNGKKRKFFKWIIDRNNKFVLSNKKKPKKIMLLIPKCLQNSECINNIIDSIENCNMCGKCKIKNLLEIKHSLGLHINIDIKTATGGQIAKFYVEEYKPDYVIAIACEKELLEGIRETKKYSVLAISNIIIDKPCVNTDVEIEKIKSFLEEIVK